MSKPEIRGESGVPGVKFDGGKQLTEDVFSGFSNALSAVADVGTFGANKYTLNGWETVPDGERRYSNASGRHRLARQSGQAVDVDSGLAHLAHEAWNILAVLELSIRAQQRQESIQDRSNESG